VYADTDLGAIGQDGVVGGFLEKPFTAESLVDTIRDIARAS